LGFPKICNTFTKTKQKQKKQQKKQTKTIVTVADFFSNIAILPSNLKRKKNKRSLVFVSVLAKNAQFSSLEKLIVHCFKSSKCGENIGDWKHPQSFKSIFSFLLFLFCLYFLSS